ncbi:PhoX family protein [Massilia agilis]|uniref:PhoX family protein n=1 Tax=Massilia agilis TaxID=1811226 RepID=A0ABT2D625_9BURK|nr:PhoX family protein [Massilia agilis]MCS0806770.1 PhoX family protein [Massilia agilis]
MTQDHDLSRRRIMRLFGAAPMLPFTSFGAGALLAGCGSDNGPVADATPPAPVNLASVTFSATPAPTLANAAAMATTNVASTMTVSFSDSSKIDFKLSYQPFFITGDMVADGKGGKILAGGYYDINNKPIMDTTVAGKERQFFSDSPDGTSLLSVPNATVPGVKGNTVFAVVQFEYTTWAQDGVTGMYGRLPSPIAILTLDQDRTTGKLSLVKYYNVDTSGANGLWITCGASLSPWGTHLSSEEYEPNAFTADTDAQFKAFSKNLYGSETAAKAYNYGHLPEVTVNPDGTGSIKKHYCLGRISHELVQVMPDNRTVFMGDDATNSGYFVFVADREKDLSSGTLYVAKVGAGFSLDPAAPAAPLTWIKLGSATSDEIRALANSLKPTDIMSLKTADPQDPAYKKIVVNGKVEWIKINAGMEKAAAFLETHRYAAFVGASMGFTKMEGTTVNIKGKVAYSALQNCVTSMVAGHALNVPGNGISIPKMLDAGAVMALSLKGGQTDTDGGAINSEWMPADTKALLVGEDLAAADALGNTANPERIAQPDNLKFSEKMRTLFIGEDSSQHVTSFLWAYNVDTKVLTRLMSVPAGGESTGLHAVDELNGWTYIMSNFQHPGDWGSAHAGVKATLDPLVRANYKDKFGAAVGYLTADVSQVKLAKA